PGITTLSISAITPSIDSGDAGGCSGNFAVISPGATRDRTGYCSIPDRYSAIQSTIAWPYWRNSSTGISPSEGACVALRSLVIKLLLNTCCFQLRLAGSFKLCSRFPLRVFVGLGHAVADGQEKLKVLNRSAHIPVRIYLIIGRVIVVLVPVIVNLLAIIRGLTDEIFAPVWIERGHAYFSNSEVGLSRIEACVRRRRRVNNGSLHRHRFALVIVGSEI